MYNPSKDFEQMPKAKDDNKINLVMRIMIKLGYNE